MLCLCASPPREGEGTPLIQPPSVLCSILAARAEGEGGGRGRRARAEAQQKGQGGRDDKGERGVRRRVASAEGECGAPMKEGVSK